MASYLESLKDIGKEQSPRNAKKKLPTLQNYQHDINGQSDSDDDLSLPATSSSPLSPAPPTLSSPGDLLSPQQDYNSISPISEQQTGMTNHYNGHQYRSDLDQDEECDIVEDEVLNLQDIEKLNPIHYQHHDGATCRAWDIPERFNMVELARRLSQLTETQADKLYSLVQKYQTNTMTVNQKDGKKKKKVGKDGRIVYCLFCIAYHLLLLLLLDQLTMDLYSLGTPLLTHIWNFTEKNYGNDNDQD